MRIGFLVPIIAALVDSASYGTHIGDTIYVNKASIGLPANGIGWNQAFRSVQEGLAVAQPDDQIWVAQGIYVPDSDLLGRDSRFIIPIGVGLFGGFSGWESSLTQRMIGSNPTILSGDIGTIGDSTDNCYNVVYFDNPDSSNVIDGFIIEKGFAVHDDPFEPLTSPRRNGGGIYVRSTIPALLHVVNCHFRSNTAMRNGGAFFAESAVGVTTYFDECTFEMNKSGSRGGAISMYGGMTSTGNFVRNSNFLFNVSDYGGAISVYNSLSDSLGVYNCYFEGNEGSFGSAFSFYSPIAIVDEIELNDCRFWRNINTGNGSSGAIAIYCSNFPIHDVKVSRCIFDKQRTLESSENSIGLSVSSFRDPIHVIVSQCDFISDRIFVSAGSNELIRKGTFILKDSRLANTHTSALLMHLEVYDSYILNSQILDNGSTIRCFVHCTIMNSLIARNTLPGHLPLIRSKTLEVHNSIFWQTPIIKLIADSIIIKNSLTDNAAFDSLFSSEGGLIPVKYSLLDSIKFEIDPLFVDADNSNFHLKSCSPAVNAGLNEKLDDLEITRDFAQLPRIVGDLVDIGPYEHQSPFLLRVDSIEDVSCSGLDNGLVDLLTQGDEPLEVYWTSPMGNGTNVENLRSGVYKFFLKDSSSCIDSVDVIITEPSELVASSTVHDVKCFGDESGSIQVNTSGGTQPYSIIWSTGLTGPYLNDIGAGEYSVTITDMLQCSVELASTVNENSPIQIEIEVMNPSSDVLHNGYLEVISISGGVPPYNLEWENKTNDTIRDSLSHGLYILEVTDSFGCTVIREIILTPEVEIGDSIIIGIWPNPISRHKSLFVHLISGESFPLEIQLIDGIGRYTGLIAKNENISQGLNQFSYDFDLPYGVYFIRFLKKEQQLAVFKLAVVSD